MADVQEVFMDIPRVEALARAFRTFQNVLNVVSRVMKATILALKATAFLGMVGNLALANYLERIEPKVKRMAQKMEELSGDVTSAIKAYRDGDMSGSQRFVG